MILQKRQLDIGYCDDMVFQEEDNDSMRSTPRALRAEIRKIFGRTYEIVGATGGDFRGGVGKWMAAKTRERSYWSVLHSPRRPPSDERTVRKKRATAAKALGR